MAAGSGDPMITMLKGAGFSVVRLPRKTLQPFLVLKKEDSKYIKLGHITDVFESQEPLPQVEMDEPTASISGMRSGKTQANIGLKILDTALKALGGGFSVGGNFERAKSVQFQFNDVLMDSVDILPLARWIRKAEILDDDVVEKFLDDDKICIMLSTLKTNSITVQAFDSSGRGVELSVPEIQGIVGASVNVSQSNEAKLGVTFTGNDRLVFGFQPLRLFFENGELSAFKVPDPGAGTLGLRHASEPEVIGMPHFELQDACFSHVEE